MRPPFDLSNVAATADAFGAGLLVLDYIQRIAPPGDYADNNRGSVNATMDCVRKFADIGGAVLMVAAVARTKDSKGRVSYDGAGLNLASFRESSELEFGADDAFMLVPDPKDEGQVILRHLKARHGETRDIVLTFDWPYQRFLPAGDGPHDGQRSGIRTLDLQAMWAATTASDEGEEEEEDDA